MLITKTTTSHYLDQNTVIITCMVTQHDYDGVGSFRSVSIRKKPTRRFKDFEIRSYANADIIAGIRWHYPADLDTSITKFNLISKYLVTDKGVLYATHNFTRGYTATEKACYKNARLKVEEYDTKLAVANASESRYHEKKAITRWKKLRQEYLATCSAIDDARKQKRLTRLSDKSTVAVSFNDAYSYSDEQKRELAEQGIEVKTLGIKDKVEALGYTVKQHTNRFKIKVYDTLSRTFRTEYLEY